MQARTVFVLYLVALHAFVLVMAWLVLWRPNLLGRLAGAGLDMDAYRREVGAFLERVDASAPPGRVVCVGDSHVQGLAVTRIANGALNFGIGSETADGVRARVAKLRCLETAKALVVVVGHNDLRRRDEADLLADMSAVLTSSRASLPILVVAIPPVAAKSAVPELNERIAAVNPGLQALTTLRERTGFVDAHADLADAHGYLRDDYHVGDGLHLNAAGNERFAARLRAGLEAVLKQ